MTPLEVLSDWQLCFMLAALASTLTLFRGYLWIMHTFCSEEE